MPMCFNELGAITSQGAVACAPGAYAAYTVAEVEAFKGTPFKATADDYAAVSVIFGAILATSCVVWGVKKVYNLVAMRPEA